MTNPHYDDRSALEQPAVAGCGLCAHFIAGFVYVDEYCPALHATGFIKVRSGDKVNICQRKKFWELNLLLILRGVLWVKL